MNFGELFVTAFFATILTKYRSIAAQSANVSRELQRLGNVLGVSIRGGSFIA
jgi:hypothetical protein